MPSNAQKWLLSTLAGLLLTAAFPPGRLAWTAWFALVPLFKALEGERPPAGFKWGFVAGMAHYLTLIYWVVVVLGHYGGLHPILSSGALLLLASYLSLYPAVFSYLLCQTGGLAFPGLLAATLWVALEYLRAHVLTGFPWCLLGYSQYAKPTLIQVADLTGVYGLSFLLVLASALIHGLLFRGKRRRRGPFAIEILLFHAALFSVLLYGRHQLSRSSGEVEQGAPLRAAVVQGNIDQSVKWEPEFQQRTLETYRRLSRTTYGFEPELIVWPETSVPFFFQVKGDPSEKVLAIARESGAHLVFGSPAYSREAGKTQLYNRAYLLDPAGEVRGYYDKVHLVPFGEYVPLQALFPFLHRLVQAAGDFDSGENLSPLTFPGPALGVLICFEIIFPELARAQAARGAEVLVNLTNDAWYGMTSAPFQHLCMAVFRAVENRRPLIRSANTGISAFIDSDGRILGRTELFEEEALCRELRVTDGSVPFYTRHGDLFAVALVFIGLTIMLFVLYSKRLRARGGDRKAPS